MHIHLKAAGRLRGDWPQQKWWGNNGQDPTIWHALVNILYQQRCMFFYPWHNSPQWARASSLSRFHDDTQKHHTRQDSSGRVMSPSQRPIPDSTQHSQQTNIHVPGGIRTHNLSKLAAADRRLRPRGQWDRQRCILRSLKIKECW
jgi:hypothetical protein